MQYKSLRSRRSGDKSGRSSPNRSSGRFYSSLTRGRRASRWEKIPTLINNKFRVYPNQPLGKGSFGVIYDGYSTEHSISVAVKFEAMGQADPQLAAEAKLYRKLWGEKDVIGIPKIYYWGVESNYTCLVMEKLGPSLEDLFTFCGKGFTLKTVLMLAEQMISRFEYFHEKNFLHRDVKPENFVMGVGTKGNHVYLLDYGLAKKYRVDKKHIRKSVFESLTGTVRYTSINSHNGITQSRRDDLESLGYIFVYFLKGGLPWQGIPARTKRKKYNKIRKKKIDTSLSSLCKGLPACFVRYFKYVRGLKFDERPNYDHLRKIFRKEFLKREYSMDFNFDWNQRHMDLFQKDRVHVYVSDIGKEEQKTASIPSPRTVKTPRSRSIGQNGGSGSSSGKLLLNVPEKGFVRIEEKVGVGNPGSHNARANGHRRKVKRRKTPRKEEEEGEEETEGEDVEEEEKEDTIRRKVEEDKR